MNESLTCSLKKILLRWSQEACHCQLQSLLQESEDCWRLTVFQDYPEQKSLFGIILKIVSLKPTLMEVKPESSFCVESLSSGGGVGMSLTSREFLEETVLSRVRPEVVLSCDTWVGWK